MTAGNFQSRNLVAACGAISVFGLAFGMGYPLLSLLLESRGVSSDIIGLNAAMMPLGILLFSPFIPRAANVFGARNVLMAAALISSALMLAYWRFDNLTSWFLLRLLQGMAIAVLFVLSEAWIVEFAGDTHRGKVVAIYAATLSASFGVGPFLLGIIGIDGALPFVIAACVMALGAAPLLGVREAPRAASPTAAAGILHFAPKAPMLLACVAVFAVFDAATLSLLPVYGIKNQLSLSVSANMLSVLIIGNVALQFPIGWLADRFAHRTVLAGCALMTALLLLALPFVLHSFWLWPLLALAGASGYGVYTVSLTSLGDRFSGRELVEGASAFAVMWGLGALFGAVSSGALMRVFGVHALPLGLAAAYFFLVVGLRRRRR